MFVTQKYKNNKQINLNANPHSARPVSDDNDTNCVANICSSKATSDSLLLSERAEATGEPHAFFSTEITIINVKQLQTSAISLGLLSISVFFFVFVGHTCVFS